VRDFHIRIGLISHLRTYKPLVAVVVFEYESTNNRPRTRAVEPEPGVQALFDVRNKRQKLLDGGAGAGASISGFGSAAIVCGISELHK